MKTKVVAHRGASGLVEFDNSIESFRKAIEIGADMVEFDVRRTKDGELIAFHDLSIEERKISELKYDEILEFSKKKGYKVPLVEEVIQLCEGKVGLDIELKERGYEEEVIELVREYLDYDEFLMKSFCDETVNRINEHDPDIKTGLLLGVEEPTNRIKTRLSELFPKRRLERCRADFVSPNHKLLKFFFLKRMRKAGFEVYVWTVNDIQMIRKLFEKSVTGIITDRPDLALKYKKND